MLYVDMSIAKIIKICRRGLVTRRSVSAANKTNHENYESASKASKQRQRQNFTYFIFILFIYSVLRLVCRELRPVSKDEEILVIEREYRLWFLLGQHIALAWISSRREVRSNPISSIGWSLNSRSFVMRLLVCGWLG